MSPPMSSSSKSLSPKEAVTQEVIDVEQCDKLNGDALNSNKADNKNKGKAVQFESASNDEQYAGSASDCYNATDNIESYPGSSPLSNDLLDPDSLIYEDDDDYYYDKYGDGMEEEEEEEEETPDEYSKYQDLFDGKDVPTGVEVSMDWFPNSTAKETASSSGSSAKNATKGSSGAAVSVSQPWKALPHNAQGVIPSNAYALPQSNKALPWTYSSNIIEPQTPDTVMGEAPATSGLPKIPKFDGFVSTRPRVEEVISATNSSRAKRNMEDYLGTYLFFKRFDIVEDFSDHHYASKGATSKQHSKEWVRKITEEWRILEKDLPEMIFVRAYESRMDLLRAVIIGAEGTPYHDGLFFFDIFFPDTYPSMPPSVHYHAGGLRINPNLYNCGKVCLSLLGTWQGSQMEKWIPNDSTMLQVLVSIQGLILNQNPYFNEPGFVRTAGSEKGEASSKAYSENTLLLSLKTMVYNMRRPPKYFEDFSYGHFFSCAHEVLKACNAYRNGAPVGSVVKGDVQDVEKSSESSSKKFRKDVADFVESLLLKEFILLGVLGLEPEREEDKPEETTSFVAESSSKCLRSSSKRGKVSSS
ncbi:unnamed protein product [Cochlearia groenlandica]